MQDGAMADLLDIREAAEFLRVSETSLRRWTNAGRLPCLRIGGRRERRFRRSDLLAFLGTAGDRAQTATQNHFCGFYTSDVDRARAAAAFLATALQPHVLCLLVAAKDVQRIVISLLEQDRPSIQNDVRAGRLAVAEYYDSATAQLDYWNRRLRAARDDGMSRVQLVADVSGGGLGGGEGGGRLPLAEILDYEAEYGRSIARRFPVTTLCQYDARRLSGLDAAALLQCHDGARH